MFQPCERAPFLVSEKAQSLPIRSTLYPKEKWDWKVWDEMTWMGPNGTEFPLFTYMHACMYVSMRIHGRDDNRKIIKLRPFRSGCRQTVEFESDPQGVAYVRYVMMILPALPPLSVSMAITNDRGPKVTLQNDSPNAWFRVHNQS